MSYEQKKTTDLLDWDEQKVKLSGTLNTCTILTFIGSGFGMFASVYGYWRAQISYDNMSNGIGRMEGRDPFLKIILGPDPTEMARRSLEYKTPILMLQLMAYGLCIYGALQMRKRKRTGFYIYSIGELLPIVVTAVIFGFGLLGLVSLISLFIIPLVFLTLYGSQLKHLS